MSYHAREMRDPKDLAAIVDMAVEFHKENRPELVFDADVLMNRGAQVLMDHKRQTINAFVCCKDDLPIGFLVGTCTQYFFSTQMCAQQELVYVLPEYRGLTPFRKLIDVFEEWASVNGAVEIYTGVSVHEPEKADKISRLLERTGFKKVGYYHMKGVNK